MSQIASNANSGQSHKQKPPHSHPQSNAHHATSALQSIQGLEKLREKILLAVDEIEHLRAENSVLAQRLQALEVEMHDTRSNVSALQLADDPENLRRKVEQFISAMDQYLQTETDLNAETEV